MKKLARENLSAFLESCLVKSWPRLKFKKISASHYFLNITHSTLTYILSFSFTTQGRHTSKIRTLN